MHKSAAVSIASLKSACSVHIGNSLLTILSKAFADAIKDMTESRLCVNV